MTRPNFIFICTDQQRSNSLGCYGNQYVRSPNIDSIGNQGMRFNRHITPMQICSPSRATMITGLYPRHHRLAVNGMALPEDIPTVPEILSEAGYRTHGVGKQHLQPLLAPADRNMPDSRAFWDTEESKDWDGPYYGYETLDLLLGESDTAHLAGHYANWLNTNHAGMGELLSPESAGPPQPKDLDEIWRSAMPTEFHYNTWITQRSKDFLNNNSSSEQPFFLFVSYPDPHHPFDPPAEYADRYEVNAMPLPTVKGDELSRMPPYYGELYPKGQGFRELYWAAHDDMEAGSMITTELISDDSMRMAIAHTHALVEMIDDGVGEILETLNLTGKSENTHIIFTSDHGELLGDHGLLHKGPPSYRQLTEVSFLIKGPGIRSGGVTEQLTNHIDLVPTLLELAGVDDSRYEFDGQSFCQIIKGEDGPIREFNFGEYHPRVFPELYNQTVSTENWRLTLYPARPEWGELFDLRKDPGEHFNVFNESENNEIITKLSKELASQFPPKPDIDNEALCKW
jgi:arylsulfatase